MNLDLAHQPIDEQYAAVEMLRFAAEVSTWIKSIIAPLPWRWEEVEFRIQVACLLPLANLVISN